MGGYLDKTALGNIVVSLSRAFYDRGACVIRYLLYDFGILDMGCQRYF